VANETLYKYFIPYFTFRAAELLNTHLSCGAPFFRQRGARALQHVKL